MDKVKQYVVFTVLGCLVVLAAGWMLLVSPKRTAAAELRAEAETTRVANDQLRTQLTVLRAKAKDLPKEQAKLASVAAKIPDNPALPALIRALVTAGKASGVELVSVTPGPPVLTVGAVPVAPGGAAAAAAPAPVAPAAGAVAAPSAAESLASIPISLNVAGGYFQVQQFLAELETLPRSMRVTGLTVTPGANPVKPAAGVAGVVVEDGRAITSTITAQVFMAANRAPAAAVTVPVAPVSAPKK